MTGSEECHCVPCAKHKAESSYICSKASVVEGQPDTFKSRPVVSCVCSSHPKRHSPDYGTYQSLSNRHGGKKLQVPEFRIQLGACTAGS